MSTSAQIHAFKERLPIEFEKILASNDLQPILHNFVEFMNILRTNPITSNLIKSFEDKNSVEKKKFTSLTLGVVEEEFCYRWNLASSKEYKQNLLFIRSPKPVEENIEFDPYTVFVHPSNYHPIGRFSLLFDCIDFPPNTSEKIRKASPLEQFWKSNKTLRRNGYLDKTYVRNRRRCDFSFLWKMLCLLEEIYLQQINSCLALPRQAIIKNRTASSREYNWNLAVQRSHLFNLQLALNPIGETFYTRMQSRHLVPDEYLFTFEDIKTCIDLLQRELNLFVLSRLETIEKNGNCEMEKTISKKFAHLEKKIDSASLSKKTRKKIDEIQRHAIKYRKAHPQAKNQEIYRDYLERKIHSNPYEYERWRRDVTKEKLKKLQEKW